MTNMTGFNNATSLYDLVELSNTATGGISVFLVVLAIFIVVLVGLLRQNPPQEAMLSASLVASIVSIMFFAGGLLDAVYVTGFVVILAGSAISIALNK